MPMATRTRSKTGKGNGVPSSPGQYQTLLSYRKLKPKEGAERKKANKSKEPISITENSTERKSTQNTEVKIKQENIDKTQSKSSYGSTENKEKVEKNEEKNIDGSNEKDDTKHSINVTQSPTGKRRSAPTLASNKKKRYFTPITELLHNGRDDKLPTLTQIIESTDSKTHGDSDSDQSTSFDGNITEMQVEGKKENEKEKEQTEESNKVPSEDDKSDTQRESNSRSRATGETPNLEQRENFRKSDNDCMYDSDDTSMEVSSNISNAEVILEEHMTTNSSKTATDTLEDNNSVNTDDSHTKKLNKKIPTILQQTKEYNLT